LAKKKFEVITGIQQGNASHISILIFVTVQLSDMQLGA